MPGIAVPYYIGDPLPEFAVDGIGMLPTAAGVGTPEQRMVRLFDTLAGWVAGQHRPLIHAPDCMAPLGVVAGLQRAGIEADLIWLDAHGDFNTWETTPSGYLGGMPVAMLTARGDQSMVSGLGIRPLADTSVVIADARDLDPGERGNLAQSQVRVMAVAEAVEVAPKDRPLYVHLDLDVIDSAELPGLLYPAPGGPSAGAVLAALQHLVALPGLVAVSVAHTYTHRGPEFTAARAVVAPLLDLLGSKLA